MNAVNARPDERRPAATNDAPLRAAALHAASWTIAFLLVWVLFHYAPPGSGMSPFWAAAFAITVTAALPAYLVFWCIDRWQAWWVRAAAVVAVVAGTAVASTVAVHVAHAWLGLGHDQETSPPAHAIGVAFNVLVAVAVRAGFRGYVTRRTLVRANRLAEDAELRALNSQLAAHTLFNLLNSVYAAVHDDRELALRLVTRLADMMRYLVENAASHHATARDECEFMRNCAEFARVRTPDGGRVSLELSGDESALVPRMLCATLFENALKYGRREDGTLDVVARLDVSGNDAFRFRVDNALPAGAPTPPGTGSGLSNVRRRLATLHPGRHRIEARVTGDRFVADVEVWTR